MPFFGKLIAGRSTTCKYVSRRGPRARGARARARPHALHYIDFHRPNRTQPGHCTRSTHHHRTGDSLMVSRLVVIVHVRKVQNAPRPIRFSRVNPHLGAPSCHQHGECVPPRRLELRRRPVVQVHITILVVRLGNAAFEKPLRSRSPNSSRFQTEGHELNTMRGLLLPTAQCLMPRRNRLHACRISRRPPARAVCNGSR